MFFGGLNMSTQYDVEVHEVEVLGRKYQVVCHTDDRTGGRFGYLFRHVARLTFPCDMVVYVKYSNRTYESYRYETQLQRVKKKIEEAFDKFNLYPVVCYGNLSPNEMDVYHQKDKIIEVLTKKAKHKLSLFMAEHLRPEGLDDGITGDILKSSDPSEHKIVIKRSEFESVPRLIAAIMIQEARYSCPDGSGSYYFYNPTHKDHQFENTLLLSCGEIISNLINDDIKKNAS